MRTFHRKARQHGARQLGAAAILSILMGAPAAFANDDRYIINQNQTGITLPGVATPNGFDEVRAADGTTCRSSVAGSGAYIDSGVIGGGLNGSSSNTLSAYGRLVMPLGAKPPRLDCDKLYQLELQRLELEVQLLKQGLDPRATATKAGAWANDDGWTNKNRR